MRIKKESREWIAIRKAVKELAALLNMSEAATMNLALQALTGTVAKELEQRMKDKNEQAKEERKVFGYEPD